MNRYQRRLKSKEIVSSLMSLDILKKITSIIKHLCRDTLKLPFRESQNRSSHEEMNYMDSSVNLHNAHYKKDWTFHWYFPKIIFLLSESLTLRRIRNITLNEKVFLDLASSLEHLFQRLKNQSRMIGQRSKCMLFLICSLHFRTTRRRLILIQITGITIWSKN